MSTCRGCGSILIPLANAPVRECEYCGRINELPPIVVAAAREAEGLLVRIGLATKGPDPKGTAKPRMIIA